MIKLFFSLIIVASVILGVIFLKNNTSVTSALLEAYPNGISVIYEHELKDGTIAIFRQKGHEQTALSFNYVKRDFGGNYHATYNGTVDAKGMYEHYGFAYMIMMNEVAIKQWKLSSPSIIGLIENENITNIFLMNDSETFIQEVEIIRIEESQPILFADLSNFPQEEDKIKIIAYDDNKEVISLIQEQLNLGTLGY